MGQVKNRPRGADYTLFGVHVDPDVKLAVQIAAKHEQISASQWVEQKLREALIADYYQTQGNHRNRASDDK
jgi:hypothetical protein